MAKASWEEVSNFDQSKELATLTKKGVTNSATGLFHPPVRDTTRKH
jgi:hypothetical protein